MTPETTPAQIIRLITDSFELEPERVTVDARLYEDLELDSIDALDMVAKLQELTHQRIPEEELRKLRTVGDVVEMVERFNVEPDQS